MANSARERSTCAAGALSERLKRVSSWRSSAVSGRRGSFRWRDMGHLGARGSPHHDTRSHGKRPTSRAVLGTALAVARTFDSYIEGLALGPTAPDVIITDVGTLPILDPDNRREMAQNARQRFEAWMTTQSVPPRPEEPHGLCCGWHGDELVDDDALGCRGRAFDLIVIGRPGSGRDQPRMATAESALFDSGRPVLLVPPSV